jgi:hypothetical protein
MGVLIGPRTVLSHHDGRGTQNVNTSQRSLGLHHSSWEKTPLPETWVTGLATGMTDRRTAELGTCRSFLPDMLHPSTALSRGIESIAMSLNEES